MQTTQMETNQPASGCFAVKVRSRGEVAVSGALRQKGYEVFTPTYSDTRKYSDRIKKMESALFPGYIFVRLNANELLPVVSTEGVSYVVKSGGTLQPLPIEEELTVQSLCSVSEGCEPCSDVGIGERVQIESGPLRGRQGTLVRRDGKDRVVLSLTTILSSVSIDLRNTIVKACAV